MNEILCVRSGFEMAVDVLERQWPIRVGLLLLPAATLKRPQSERKALRWSQLTSGERLTVGFNMLEDGFGAIEGVQFAMRAAEQATPAAVIDPRALPLCMYVCMLLPAWPAICMPCAPLP